MAIGKHINISAASKITPQFALPITGVDPRILVNPEIKVLPRPPQPQPTPRPLPAPPPTTTPVPRPAPAPTPTVPVAPGDNPFLELPFPTAGSRIKSEDFRRLAQCLTIIHDAFALAGTLIGHDFGTVKGLLASQQYTVARVISVFGNEIEDLADPSLDARKVIQVVPTELGGRSVSVVVTEAVETRRLTPKIVGLSYADASEKLRDVLGDATLNSTPTKAPRLVGLPLAEARRILSR